MLNTPIDPRYLIF